MSLHYNMDAVHGSEQGGVHVILWGIMNILKIFLECQHFLLDCECFFSGILGISE